MAFSKLVREFSVAVLRKIRPRDELGWRVPRPGTIAADIYALAKKGLSTGEIAKELGRERNNVGVHLFKIKRPERGNQLGNGWKKKRTRERKPITPEEAHARKVAGVLDLPLHQARAIVSGER
jgi:predicted transcriptional regulator